MANTDREKNEQSSRELTGSRQGTQVARHRGYDPFTLNPSEFFSNPFSAMRRVHEEMDRVFSEAFGGRGGGSGIGGGLAAWAPAIEIAEKDNEVVVCAELPGLKPEDVKVEVTDEALVIEGERKQEREEKQGGRWHTERSYGHFHRTIPLPEGAKVDQARADFKNGELQVTVPVERSSGKRRQIPIGGASSSEQKQK